MKRLLLILLVWSSLKASAQQQHLYDFKMKTIDGELFDFSKLKGKKVLIVNTASKCGNTPQYDVLERLFKKYGPEKFMIVGFPANDFMRQEPGTNEEIKAFCQKNYGVSFMMMEKISVKGDDMAPIYKWLTTKSLNGISDYSVGWNFSKFLVDENGVLVGHVAPSTAPDCEEIINFIEGKSK